MFKGSFHCRKNFAHGGMAVWGGGVNVCPEGPWRLTEGEMYVWDDVLLLLLREEEEGLEA